MKQLLSFILLTVFLTMASNAFGVVKRNSRDLKLPTQVMLEKQTITNPAAAGTDEILSADAGNTSTAEVVVTTLVAQPDLTRNIVMTPGGTTADVAACDVVIVGTDFHGDSLTETLSFAENASTATTGAKAFKTITSVTYPANCEDTPFGATWSIGYGEKIGLKRCMDSAGHAVFSTVAGAYEATRATVTASSTLIESNTADFNGTMNGANDFEIFFIQNFRCL